MVYELRVERPFESYVLPEFAKLVHASIDRLWSHLDEDELIWCNLVDATLKLLIPQVAPHVESYYRGEGLPLSELVKAEDFSRWDAHATNLLKQLLAR